MKENWYLILGLEVDPPVEDPKVIDAKIEEKSKKWANQSRTDANNANRLKSYLDRVQDIKKAMHSPETRQEMIDDAVKNVYEPMDQILKTISLKRKEIPEATAKKIAETFKEYYIDLDQVENRAKKLNIAIDKTTPIIDYEKIYEDTYKKRPDGTRTFRESVPLLETIHADDLYSFLYPGRDDVREPWNLGCEKLRQRAAEIRQKYEGKPTSESTAVTRLCGCCEDYFKNDETKEQYDEYLRYNRRKKILEKFRKMCELLGECTQEEWDDALDRLTALNHDRGESENILTAFCKHEGIPVPGDAAAASGARTKMKYCRCGWMYDPSEKLTVCASCGLPLEIKCPKCGKKSDNNIEFCAKCGFDFKNIDKAAAYCDLADHALMTLDFEDAGSCLKDAESFWPGYEKAKELRKRLDELKGRVGPIVARMREAASKKRYYEAKQQLDRLKAIAPSYSEKGLEEEINSSVKAAESYKKKAQMSKSEDEIIDACMKAYDAAADCPGIQQIMAKYPPAAPTGLSVSANPVSETNVISWKRSTTKGILNYVIIRKNGAVPVSAQDGTRVGCVGQNTVTDMGIVAGVPYFYAVFAERAGIYSDALVQSEAVTNFFEISNVRITTGDESIHLAWDPIPDDAKVELERTDPSGKKKKIPCSNRKQYTDSSLKNDEEYKYRVYLVYSAGNKETATAGVTVTGTPARPPMPVKNLKIMPVKENEFSIEWINPEDCEVRFFSSTQKPNYLPGDQVPLSVLDNAMEPLILRKTSPESGTFSYEGEGRLYITAVSVKNDSAVIGAIASANKGGFVKIKRIAPVNGKIMILLEEQPKGATGFIVLYRFDHFAEDISDKDARRKYISLKQYQYDSALVIDSLEPKDYYFSVFAEFRANGDTDYSPASDRLFSNKGKETITYTVSGGKKAFGKGSVTITFQSENREFRLPDIDILSAQGNAPMFRDSGSMFYQVDGQEVNGSLSVNIPIEKNVPKNTFIRPFLRDRDLSGRYVLKLKAGLDLKIS